MKRLSLLASFGALLVLAFAGSVPAAQQSLYNAGDEAEGFVHYGQQGHITKFQTPTQFSDSYLTTVSVYGRRYGSSSGSITVVLMDSENKPIARQVVNYEEFQFQGNWVEVSFNEERVPSLFKVGVFTGSGEENGVDVGWTPPGEGALNSQFGHPALEIKEFPDGEEKEWMIRANVTDQLVPDGIISPADLPSGETVLFHDTGEIADVANFGNGGAHDRGGPVVKFGEEGVEYRIESVYMAARAMGEWYRSERNFAVNLLNTDLGLVDTGRYPFSTYTAQPAWVRLPFEHTEPVPGPFYIQVSVRSVEDVQLFVGYDQSGNSDTSFVGVPGSIREWEVTPEQSETNWLIRVETVDGGTPIEEG